jgi:AAHS family 4-hydroxybenzoate transporter-like MFS transporter
MTNETTLNVTRLIDEKPVGRLQILVFLLCAGINLLDGIDTQSIGVAAPFIAAGLGIKMAEFGPVFSAALFGATLGAIGFGMLADRVGRKPLLVVALITIGVFTLATAVAPSAHWLMLFRFIAGIGLGGATPCFITLTSEYAPARSRAAWTTLMWAGFPFGAMIGALLNSVLIADFGWRAIFYVGGVLPLVVAVVVAVLLPESLKFLVANPRKQAAARRVLQRMGIANVNAETRLVADDNQVSRPSLRHVFTEGRAVGTLLLWVPFFMGFGILTVAVLWTPSLLRMNGISPSATAFVVAFNGLGACVGQASAGYMISRFGLIRTLVPAFVLGAAATVGLGFGASSVALAATFIGLNGLFIGFGAAGAIALAALIYPTAIRSTGVGLGMAMGRFGQMIGPLIAGALLGYGWHASQIMTVIGAGGLVAAVFVLWFKRWSTLHHGSVPA